MRVFVIGGEVESGEGAAADAARKQVVDTCRRLGAMLRTAGHTVLLCSPFEDSADLHVLRGIAGAASARPADIEIHCPDTPQVRRKFDVELRRLRLESPKRIFYPPPQTDSKEARQYAWLFCQLAVLDTCHVVIAVGGKVDGAANMLLLLAKAREKPILPIPFLGGAAQQAFYRHRHELLDLLGEDIDAIQDASALGRVVPLAKQLALPAERRHQARRTGPLKFFISYPRARPQEADYVEALLRRRNLQVFRDEKDFGAGHEIPGLIKEAVHAADVFIATWCREYACSPWCFDELEMALDRLEAGSLKNLWILRVDDTRMIPRRARNLRTLPIRSRQELEGEVLNLLERVGAVPD
jgi:hypothetical protein